MEISRATLDGWVMRVGELLSPVVEAMRQDLLGASYLQADETTVPVQLNRDVLLKKLAALERGLQSLKAVVLRSRQPNPKSAFEANPAKIILFKGSIGVFEDARKGQMCV